MKTEQPILISSFLAVADINKNELVNYSGSRALASEKVLGVCNADTSEGELCPVMLQGIALVKSGAAVSSGSFVGSDDQGRVVSNSFTTHSLEVIGVVLDSASGADELIRIKLF